MCEVISLVFDLEHFYQVNSKRIFITRVLFLKSFESAKTFLLFFLYLLRFNSSFSSLTADSCLMLELTKSCTLPTVL